MRKKSDEAKLIRALQALENDLELSGRAATATYTVDFSSLGRRRRGQSSRRDIIPNSR